MGEQAIVGALCEERRVQMAGQRCLAQRQLLHADAHGLVTLLHMHHQWAWAPLLRVLGEAEQQLKEEHNEPQ